MVEHKKYSMSFSTGGLFRIESLVISEVYTRSKNWNSTREEVIEKNLLQARTQATLKRICREVISRLRLLSDLEIDYLLSSSPLEQGYILWLAICRRYRFISEFAIEVLHERYISLKQSLSYDEFDHFYNKKAQWNIELDEIKPATRYKLRQVLFRMLKDADLLAPEGIIKSAMISPNFIVILDSSEETLFYPVFESDLKGANR